jgi:hypothetical protein
MATFQKELESLINRHSLENDTNTPDFVLAQFLVVCLAAFREGINRRETWHGREPATGPPRKPVPADADDATSAGAPLPTLTDSPDAGKTDERT